MPRSRTRVFSAPRVGKCKNWRSHVCFGSGFCGLPSQSARNRRTARDTRLRPPTSEIPLDTLFDQAAGEASPPLAETLPRQLSPQDREVLLWRFEQGLDYDEIANLLGISCRRAVRRRSLIARLCRAFISQPSGHGWARSASP